MKNKIMLGLVTLATCLSLASCGENVEKRDNEMEETAFSLASERCDSYISKTIQEYARRGYSSKLLLEKRLLERIKSFREDSHSSYYRWEFGYSYSDIWSSERRTIENFVVVANWPLGEIELSAFRSYFGWIEDSYFAD